MKIIFAILAGVALSMSLQNLMIASDIQKRGMERLAELNKVEAPQERTVKVYGMLLDANDLTLHIKLRSDSNWKSKYTESTLKVKEMVYNLMAKTFTCNEMELAQNIRTQLPVVKGVDFVRTVEFSYPSFDVARCRES